MPDVLGNIIALNGVNDSFLVDSSSKREDIVVFERAKCHTRSCNSETVDLLPLIFLDVINLTESIDLRIDECAYDVNISFNGTKRMICMWVNHAGLFIEVGEDFIVSPALFQVSGPSLITSTNEVDTTVFYGNRSGIKRHFKVHLDVSFLEFLVMDLENIGIFLVPLE